MKLYKLLSISWLLYIILPLGVMAQRPCKEIPASIEIQNAKPGEKGSVSVIFTGNVSSQFRLNLIAPRKEDNKLNLSQTEIKDLPAGTYDVIVVEAKEGEFCPRRFKAVIRQL